MIFVPGSTPVPAQGGLIPHLQPPWQYKIQFGSLMVDPIGPTGILGGIHGPQEWYLRGLCPGFWT